MRIILIKRIFLLFWVSSIYRHGGRVHFIKLFQRRHLFFLLLLAIRSSPSPWCIDSWSNSPAVHAPLAVPSPRDVGSHRRQWQLERSHSHFPRLHVAHQRAPRPERTQCNQLVLVARQGACQRDCRWLGNYAHFHSHSEVSFRVFSFLEGKRIALRKKVNLATLNRRTPLYSSEFSIWVSSRDR